MSDITAKGLKKVGAIDKTIMRQFDTLCSVARCQSQRKVKSKHRVATLKVFF